MLTAQWGRCFDSGPLPRCRTRAPSEQSGQIILLTLALLLTGGLATWLWGIAGDSELKLRTDTRAETALVEARHALIGYAAAHATHPGALPCPDTDDDGIGEALTAGTACPSYIGRLPWRDIGVGDLRDSAGERLWYVLSPNFRHGTTVVNPINSDTKGDRTVYSGSTITTLTTQAAAIIFAPGTAVAGQSRDSATVACTMSGVSVPMRRDRCAGNYLEQDTTAGAWDNGRASGPFMTNAPSTSTDPTSLTFNDKLLVLKSSDFMPVVEKRVAREILEVLRLYNTNSTTAAIMSNGCQCYPWPDATNTGTSTTTANRGRIPLVASPHNWGTSWTSLVTGLPLLSTAFPPIPSLPSYFGPNNWQNVIYYTVAKSNLQNSGSACTTCTSNPTLSVDGAAGYGVVLITAGAIYPSQTRSTWATYISDAQNRDANPQPAVAGSAADPAANDAYVSPPQKCPTGTCQTLVSNVQRCVSSSAVCQPNVTTPFRNHIATITAPPPNTQCGPNARTLLNNAPCHTTGNNVKAVCSSAAANLSACSCSSAATTMVNPPCRNTLNPPACQAAVNSLQTCTS